MKDKFTLLLIPAIILFMSGYSASEPQLSPGNLAKAHIELEGFDNCLKCHTLLQGIDNSACSECHEKLKQRILENKGLHARVKGECMQCHTDHKGENADISALDRKTFDHELTGYSLQDGHRVECGKCHKKEGTYSELSSECANCHIDVHENTLPERCMACHNFKEWKASGFDHDRDSRYPVTGRHSEVQCESCHSQSSSVKTAASSGKTYKTLKYSPLKYSSCRDCHADIHMGALKEKTCSRCHSTNGWKETAFNHNDPLLSDYQLKGRHEKVPCRLCHREETITYRKNSEEAEGLVLSFISIKHESCKDCHYDLHQGQFKDRNCDTCHSLNNTWKDHSYSHDSKKYKGYKLEGRHKEAACDNCHKRIDIKYTEFNTGKKISAGIFRPVKSEKCIDCHYDVHEGQFVKQKCDECHSLKQPWKTQSFSHESENYKGYKLEGRHRDVACDKCHSPIDVSYAEFGRQTKVMANKFRPLKSEACENCHKDEHKGKFTEISTVEEITCENCHTVETGWNKYIYRHKTDSKYKKYNPEGKIAESKCEACHVCDAEVFCLSCCFNNMGLIPGR